LNFSLDFSTLDSALRHGARPRFIMGLSKENRILILLVIDTAFFLLELITGGLSMDFDPE
jgi:hypothetical protein